MSIRSISWLNLSTTCQIQRKNQSLRETAVHIPVRNRASVCFLEDSKWRTAAIRVLLANINSVKPGEWVCLLDCRLQEVRVHFESRLVDDFDEEEPGRMLEYIGLFPRWDNLPAFPRNSRS